MTFSFNKFNSIKNYFINSNVTSQKYFTHSLLFLVAAFFLCLPIFTFLWTTPDVIEQTYLFLCLVFLSANLLGLICLQIQRLYTIGRGWWWVIIGWLVIPFCLFSGGIEFDAFLKKGKQLGYSPEINVISISMALAALATVIYPAFIPNKNPKLHIPSDNQITDKKTNINYFIIGSSFSLVVLLTLYAGMFQSGIYVGVPRFNLIHEEIVPFATREQGSIFAECAGFKGVSAGTQFSSIPGFRRKTDESEIKYNFILKPDNTIDILTLDKNGVTSYQKSGYSIKSAGLKVVQTESGLFQLDDNVNHFVIEASRIDLDTNPLSNLPEVASFSFTEKEYAGWIALYSSATTSPNSFHPTDPYTTAKLLIGDCYATVGKIIGRSDRLDKNRR